MIEVTEKEAQEFLYKLECLISATAIFPRLASELKVLQSIERDAKILLGKDVPVEIEKLISKLNS